MYFDQHEYDGRGKKVKTWSTSGLSDIASDYWNAIFDGIGSLTGVGRKRNGNPTTDVNEVDALGNVLKRISDSTISPQWKHVDYSVVGDQIQTIERPAYIVDGGDTSATRFKTEFGSPDVNGNQGPEDHIVYRVQVSPPSGQIANFNVIPTVGHYFSRTTYGIDNKLRYAQKTSYEPTGKVTVFTEYRYDALGRRVLTRSRRSTPCNESAYECQSTIDRFIWDGDQLIAESRGNGADTQSEASLNLDGGTGLLRGWVRYTHAGGIDEPLAVWSNNAGVDGIVPHFSWRGNVEAGTDIMTGALLESGSTPWVWPTRYKDIYLAPETRGIIPEPTRWLGSLTENQIDFNGLAYRRNRYYNTTTGRFTSEDPIGLAGGLNLYGFADGDPVNFSDPFGLFGCTRENPKDCTLGDVLRNVVAGFAASGTPGFGEDVGPGFNTGLAAGLILQARVGRAPARMGLGEGAAGPGSATRGLERQLTKHIQKLDDYRANPDAFDNLGTLRNAPTPEIRQKIIEGRIRALENQIRIFEREIAKRRGGT